MPKVVLTADLSERSAETAEDSAISSDSECCFVANVVSVVSVSDGFCGGGSGDRKTAAAMAAVKFY